MSSPDNFTLPLMDDSQDGDQSPSLPLAPPSPSLPLAPPPSLPLAPATPNPPSEPVAPDPVRPQEETETVTASTDDAEIVVVERSADGQGEPGAELEGLLRSLLERGGSDLHLAAGSPPMIRRHGDLEPVPGGRALTAQEMTEAMYPILTDRQQHRFEETKELDLAYEMAGTARFRVNLMLQRGAISAVFRAIPSEILPLDALNMPAIVGDLAALPRGLVLVTGPSGSGKSTTLAAIIDRANRTRRGHIVTIEDPIEFVHEHRMCMVNQREVGSDTASFDVALKQARRQDPDIILVGELLDPETIAIALTTAEAGHLVLGTLHTSSAAKTIDRLIDVVPPSRQGQIRTQLANSLQAVVCQSLCRTADGEGRVAATEIMVATPAVRNLIREGKLESIPSALQTGSRFGMHTLNQDLATLVEQGRITYEVARENASDPFELNQLLGKAADATS